MSAVTRIRTSEEITVSFTPEEIWEVLVKASSYSKWWPVQWPARLLSEHPGLLGTEIEVRPFFGGQFRFRFEELHEPFVMRLRFFGGRFEGPGGFLLQPGKQGSTRIRCDLDVFVRGMGTAVASQVFPLDAVQRFHIRGVLRNLAKQVGRQRKATERARAEETRIAAREAARVAAEGEDRRLAEEVRNREEETARIAAAAAVRLAEIEARLAAEAERNHLADEARKKAEAEARRLADEARRIAAAEARRVVDEARQREEAARIAAANAARAAEAEARLAAESEARRIAQEDAARRAAELARVAAEAEAEARRAAEEARIAALAEARRVSEEARKVAEAEAARLAEEARRREEETARIAAAAAVRLAEIETRLAAEAERNRLVAAARKKAEAEARRLADEARGIAEAEARQAAEEARIAALAEARRVVDEARQREEEAARIAAANAARVAEAEARLAAESEARRIERKDAARRAAELARVAAEAEARQAAKEARIAEAEARRVSEEARKVAEAEAARIAEETRRREEETVRVAVESAARLAEIAARLAAEAERNRLVAAARKIAAPPAPVRPAGLLDRFGTWLRSPASTRSETKEAGTAAPRPGSQAHFAVARAYLAALSSEAPPNGIQPFLSKGLIRIDHPHRFLDRATTSDLEGALRARARDSETFWTQTFELKGAAGGGSRVAMEVAWSALVRADRPPFLCGQELEAQLAIFLTFDEGCIVRQHVYACYEPWSNQSERERLLAERASSGSPSPLQGGPGPRPSGSNFDIARSYLAALNAGAGPEDVAAFFAPDAIQEEFPNRFAPAGARRTRDEVKQARAHTRDLLKSEHYDLRGATGGGSQVAMEIRWSAVVGMSAGPFTAGQKLEGNFAVFLKFRDGLIVRQRNYCCLAEARSGV